MIQPLLARIAKGEGARYDTTFANGKYEPVGSKKLTDMTLGEVKQLQKTMIYNGSMSSAVGRYQFIKKTLEEVQREMRLPDSQKFNAETQDAMITHRLLKTRGLDSWLHGIISNVQFQLNLSKEFASIANPYTGHSYYGQRTGTTTDQIQKALKEIKDDKDL